jgi:GntR family transcriptional regulator / MocR family aminotransferase
LHLHLDGSGSLQSQLRRALRAAILDGRLGSGQLLPPTRVLAHKLGLSRNTVVLSYEQLAAEGMINSRRGAGSFVAPTAGLQTRRAGPSAMNPAPPVSAYARRLTEPEEAAPAERRLRLDLGSGSPAVSPAMQSAWRRALIHAADNTAFDYPPPEGLTELRDALAGYLGRRRGISVDAANILIVTGIQQGIDLAARMLLDPGDVAVVEEPGYGGLRHALHAHGVLLRRVDVDGCGLRVDELTEGIPARLVAVTPSHQYPTGAELSLPRRLKLLDWAAASNAYILEDDYDGEFRHGGRPLPALKSLDQAERVIYLGSLSRVLFPAVRLGYLVVPAALRAGFIRAKRLADRGSPAIEQRALAELIRSGRFERLLLASARRLDVRRLALIGALRAHFGAAVDLSGADAGMHLCLRLATLPAACEQALVAAAADADVHVEGISPHCQRPPADLRLLLGYAQLAPEDLVEAVRRLAVVVRGFVDAAGPASPAAPGAT